MIIINARFLTQPITGVQRFAIEISKELNKSDLDVVFVAPCNIIHQDLANELNVKCIGTFKGHLWEQISLPKYVLKNNALLVSLCNTAPCFISNQIVTIHDLCFKVHPEWFSKRFSTVYNFLIPRIAKKSLHIVTVSNTSKEEIINELSIPAKKISVIYNAVAPIFLKNHNLEDSNNHLLKKKYLLTVSSHHPRKNFERMIEAFKSIENKDLFLFIVGNDNKHFANSPLTIESNPRIRFLSNIPDTDLISYYKHASLFVYPSLYEGFGIPIIEALSQQTPVCVSNIPVFKEVCGDHAVYFDPYSTLSIKNAIEYSLQNVDRFSALEYTSTITRFSWKSSASALYDLISKHK